MRRGPGAHSGGALPWVLRTLVTQSASGSLKSVERPRSGSPDGCRGCNPARSSPIQTAMDRSTVEADR